MDEYAAWIDEGGRQVRRAVQYLHPVGGAMDRVAVVVLEGPRAGPDPLIIPARDLAYDFSRPPDPGGATAAWP